MLHYLMIYGVTQPLFHLPEDAFKFEFESIKKSLSSKFSFLLQNGLGRYEQGEMLKYRTAGL